jgi:nicotinamide-nucleotide amidase
MTTDLDSLAVTVIAALDGRTVASAESVTGGLIGATLTAVPGASRVYRGGVTSYATDVKASLLGVSAALLADGGAVQAEVALAMAQGVAMRLGTEFGIAATGVAGPDWQDGKPPGTVFVACVQLSPNRQVAASAVDDLHLNPEVEDPRQIRAEVRDETVAAALELLLTFL